MPVVHHRNMELDLSKHTYSPLISEQEHQEATLDGYEPKRRTQGGALDRLVSCGFASPKAIATATLGSLATLVAIALILIWKINFGIYVSRHDCQLQSDAYFGDSKFPCFIQAYQMFIYLFRFRSSLEKGFVGER